MAQDFKVADGALGLEYLVQVGFWPKVKSALFNRLRPYLIGTVRLLVLQKDEVSALKAVCGEIAILWVYVGQGLLAAEAEGLV